MLTPYRLLLLIVLSSMALAGCNGQIPAPSFQNTPGAVEPNLPTNPSADIVVLATLTPDAVSAAQAAAFTAAPAQGEPPLRLTPNFAGDAPQKPCDMVSPGLPMDVTIPDGTRIAPGAAFAKTWRLVNTGACTWTREYSVVWFSGEAMSSDPIWNLNTDVAPGQSVDVTVDLVAPERAGGYQSNWKLRNREGQFFGLGPTGDAPFWVMIEVAEESTATAPVEPTPAPTLAVYVNGIVSLQADDGLDLDSGDLNLEPEVDVRHVKTAAGNPVIQPENGATIGMFGNREPLEQDCERAALGAQPLSMLNAETGIYLCYRTSEGLPGYAHVIRTSEEDDRVALDFITWTVP